PRHFHEEPVADVMAVGVVDLLEAVQVDERAGEPRAGAPRALDGLLQGRGEAGTVGKPGERIAVSERFDALAHERGVSDIAAHAAVPEERPVGSEPRLAGQQGLPRDPGGHGARELEVAERNVAVHACLVFRPLGRVGTERGDLPRRLADDAERYGRGGIVRAGRNVRHPVLRIGLPVEVGRHLGQAAEARFALAQRLLDLLALQELADVAADDPRRLQQPLVGLAHRLARESEHADGLAFRRDGEGQHAAHAGAFGHGLRRRADVAPQVARPGRTELPHHARALQEAVHGRLVDAPAVLETQGAARLVQTVIPAGIPAFRFAHHAHRGLQAALRVLGRGKRARYLVLQREHLLGPLLCAHVAADAVIAEKAAVGAEHRLAADAEVAHAPLDRRAPHERVVEGPAGVKERAMRVPPALDFEAALPAAQADQAPPQILVAARDVAAFEAGKAVAGVGFPVPVRGQVGEAARARGALAVCLLRRRLLHEPADAAAEGVQPVRQALVGRAHRAAAEAQHADDFRARTQRDQQRGAQAHLLEQLVAYALGPGLLQIVADPQRFSRLPHGAHHPLAPLDSALARSFDHGRGALSVQRAPMLVKAQRAAGFFHLPQLGAIPALAFADRAPRTLEREGDAARAGE